MFLVDVERGKREGAALARETIDPQLDEEDNPEEWANQDIDRDDTAPYERQMRG